MQYNLILNLLLTAIIIFSLVCQEQVKAQEKKKDDSPNKQEGQDQKNSSNQNQETDQQPGVTWTIFKHIFHERMSQIRQYSNQTYQYTIDQIKNFSQKNEEIAQKLVKDFQQDLNKTEKILQEEMEKLLKDFEEYRKKIKNLTEIVIFWKVDQLDEEIEEIKQKIFDKLEHVPLPKTICGNYMSCEYCTKNPNCIWCPDQQICASGTDIDGSYFFECEFYQYQFCNKNAQKVDKEYLHNQPPDRLINKNILVNGVLSNDQRDYYITQQHEIIQLKNKIEEKRFKIQRLMSIFYLIRQKELSRNEKETHLIYNQAEREDPFKDDDIPFLKYIEDDDLDIDVQLPTDLQGDADQNQQLTNDTIQQEQKEQDEKPATEENKQKEQEKIQDKQKNEPQSQQLKKLEKKLAKEPEQNVTLDMDSVEQQDQDIMQYIDQQIEQEKKRKNKSSQEDQTMLI